TFGLGWNQKFPTHTYLTVDAEYLKSDADRTVGILTNSDVFAPIADSPSSTHQSLDYDEKTVAVTLNQLIGSQVAVGARYQFTYADLTTRFTQIDPTIAGVPNQDVSATLNQVWLYANYNHPCGFFANINGVWSQQDNHGYGGTEPGDNFWQLNL